ncbi:MAG TPA: 2-hydroxyacyl-CoA dehydratase [Dehalococcoidia bacterium]|nr:2-hydroxyacyl-CoA dehydratase [Dehalococcoidia bacterium]
MDIKSLDEHLKNRPTQLMEAKEKGGKIVGYFPGNYVPEELIYASGAIPICLIHGGNTQSAEVALSLVPQVICPFARAQIGERLLQQNPFYRMIDMLVAPVTCQHLRKVAEIWEYRNEMGIFKLGIPQQYGNDFEVEYFKNRLTTLKDRLQILTNTEITDENLGNAIKLYNRIRELLRKISLIRQTDSPGLNTLDFIKLNHASFYADPEFMVDVLESIYREIKDKQPTIETNTPRILLLGPNIGFGDYAVLEMVQLAGGEIVIEEICEGVRYYWNDIDTQGDLFQALTKGYLIDRLPCAFMRNSAKKRLDFTMKLIKDFNVSGVIWYELLCCETYDSEAYYFAEKLGEHNIPFLILESDYSTAVTGQLKTRTRAFIEILKGVME